MSLDSGSPPKAGLIRAQSWLLALVRTSLIEVSLPASYQIISQSPNQIIRQPHFSSAKVHVSSTIAPPCSGLNRSVLQQSHGYLSSVVGSFVSDAPPRPKPVEGLILCDHPRVGNGFGGIVDRLMLMRVPCCD
nr:hypothetical protein CFP56_31037 [Quercus suber]